MIGRLFVWPATALARAAGRFVYLCQWLWYGHALRVLFRPARFSSLLAGHGIIVFVGPNGSGKSLLAVDWLLPTLAGKRWECSDVDHRHHVPFRMHAERCSDCDGRNGVDARRCEIGAALLVEHGSGDRLVWSTLELFGEDGRPHPLYRPLQRYPQLQEIEHAEVLFDEVSGVSDAADSSSMPPQMKRWIQQLRKRDVRLGVTTPAYDRCSLPIRQIATLVVDSRSFCAENDPDGRVWRPRRAMVWNAYDGFEFRTFEKNSGKTQPCLAQRSFWRPGSLASRSYNTQQQVAALVEVSESGTCGACGGQRSRPKCACPPEITDDGTMTLSVVETVSGAGGRVRKAVPVASL